MKVPWDRKKANNLDLRSSSQLGGFLKTNNLFRMQFKSISFQGHEL